jgi:hypothetical protein
MPTITRLTLKGRGAVARASGLKRAAELPVSAADIAGMSARLLLTTQREPKYSVHILKQEIALRAGMLKTSLADQSVWGRVFARFVKKDLKAAASLLTSLGYFFSENPIMGADERQRQENTNVFLSDLLFSYSPTLIRDIVRDWSESNYPALAGIVAMRTRLDPESAARVFSQCQ